MTAKAKTVWYCTSCGNETSKWMGRCPACGEWNTMKEGLPRDSRTSSAAPSRDRSLIGLSEARPTALKDISVDQDSRILIGNKEVERILGVLKAASGMIE